MRAFVTGGSGFVGRYMTQMLRDRGDEVVALARIDQRANNLNRIAIPLSLLRK